MGPWYVSILPLGKLGCSASMEISNWFWYVMLIILSLLYFVDYIMDAPIIACGKSFYTCLADTHRTCLKAECFFPNEVVFLFFFLNAPFCAARLRFGCMHVFNELFVFVCWLKTVSLPQSALVCVAAGPHAFFSRCSWEVEIRPSDVWLLPARLLRQTGTRTLADRYSRLQANQELVWMHKLTTVPIQLQRHLASVDVLLLAALIIMFEKHLDKAQRIWKLFFFKL